MENTSYSHIQNLKSNSDRNITTTIPNSFNISPIINTPTTAISTLQTLQSVPVGQSIEVYSDTNNGSNILITQPTYKKLLSETIKQEFDENSIEQKPLKFNNPQSSTLTSSVHRNSSETINGRSIIPIPMSNVSGHMLPNLNPPHLSDGTGTYFVSDMPNDLAANYKLLPSSNTDLPSPSTSSNSSNPSSSNLHNHHHPTKRHGTEGDPTRKRAVRLQKNREAARECRRKKKEYIKCLEERVTGLENQNKALIEELRQLKELYCQREQGNNNKTNTTTR